MVPVIGFSAFSGVGKTTLMEQVVRLLTERGVRVGVIKHDRHGFEMDTPGKDTWRYARAGARSVLITSPERTAVIEQAGQDLDACVRRITGADLVLVEGFKHAEIPRVGLSRKGVADLPEPPERYFAVVTDDEDLQSPVPRFAFDQAEALTDRIMEEAERMRNGEPAAPSADFTHFDEGGNARMVDVGAKDVTRRTAAAGARVLVNRHTFELIRTGGVKKGDVLTVAQVAGIMAAKRTPDLIPMCHPIALSGIDLRLWLDEEKLSVEIEATVRCDGKTGVEMEALTAAGTAALTVYDMCKAVQRDMRITDLRLLSKTGGVHGDYHAGGSNGEEQ